METEKCKNCGALLNEKAKFCFECGTIIERKTRDKITVPLADDLLKGGNPNESRIEVISENVMPVNEPSWKNDENISGNFEKENSAQSDDENKKTDEPPKHENIKAQPNYQQNNYAQQNQYNGNSDKYNPYTTPPPADSKYASVGLWSYVGMMIVFSIPIVGFILAIIWAFDTGNISRRNFARAVLVLLVISFVISVILAVVGIVFLYDIFKDLIDSMPKDGITIPFDPFDKYDIKIDGLIKEIINYRYFSDVFIF